MNTYLSEIYIKLEKKYYYQKEYLQAVNNFFLSINDLVETNSDITKLNVIERLVTPDRIITFRVPWTNDKGQVIVNTGYRVQFNNLIGPYKGGTRFDESVNESILKFLSLEQTLKNSLTGLPLGGAKGGADFSPYNKSDLEIMRFSQSYMNELYKYIGPDKDIPAGDIGVSAREIGYLYGQYKKLTGRHNASFTSKGLSYGGSLVRTEATGYGLCYITNKALDKYFNTSLDSKTVIISGSGNVGLNAAFKAQALGAKVIGMSSITGVIYDNNGIDIDLIKTLQINKESFETYLSKYPNAIYYKNPKELWRIKADVAMPCAMENELDLIDAKYLVANNIQIIAEGANMPTTSDATSYFLNNKVLVIPSKSANAGGVATSALEMSQNAMHTSWSFEEVDHKLKDIMENIFNNIYAQALKSNNTLNLNEAANIVAFNKLLEAMIAQGI